MRAVACVSFHIKQRKKLRASNLVVGQLRHVTKKAIKAALKLCACM